MTTAQAVRGGMSADEARAFLRQAGVTGLQHAAGYVAQKDGLDLPLQRDLFGGLTYTTLDAKRLARDEWHRVCKELIDIPKHSLNWKTDTVRNRAKSLYGELKLIKSYLQSIKKFNVTSLYRIALDSTSGGEAWMNFTEFYFYYIHYLADPDKD